MKLTTVKFTPKQREVLDRVRDKIVAHGWREMGADRGDLPTHACIIEEALLQWEQQCAQQGQSLFGGPVSTAEIRHRHRRLVCPKCGVHNNMSRDIVPKEQAKKGIVTCLSCREDVSLVEAERLGR